MAPQYRTLLVVKLFPSVPRGIFGRGTLGQRFTTFLERSVFYREFRITPWKALFAVAGVAALAAWAVAALALSLHALARAESMREEIADAERVVAERQVAVNAARRDYLLLLSSMTPLNEKVDELSEFSQKMAIVAGVESLAQQLGTTAADRRLDLRLSEEEIGELDRRFARLGSFVANQEFELARTPSISPLAASFVPTDRFGYRSNRLTRTGPTEAHGGNGKQFHAGLDLAAPEGTPIRATADATVHFAGRIPPKQSASASLYGNFVVLDHGNGIRTVYAHCDEVGVVAGDGVRRGDVVAWVGSTGRSTGPHVHYEVVVNGRPVDPELFVLDLALPGKRVRVDYEERSFLNDEVEKLLGS